MGLKVRSSGMKLALLTWTKADVGNTRMWVQEVS